MATDGSETAVGAAELAVEDATEHGGSVLAMHVLDTGDYAAPMRGRWQEFYENLRRGGEEIAEEVCDIADESSVQCDSAILEGDPAEEITRFAEENEVDAIYMGTVGRSGLKEVFLGSTAERVIRSATLPVTVVPS